MAYTCTEHTLYILVIKSFGHPYNSERRDREALVSTYSLEVSVAQFKYTVNVLRVTSPGELLHNIGTSCVYEHTTHKYTSGSQDYTFYHAH